MDVGVENGRGAKKEEEEERERKEKRETGGRDVVAAAADAIERKTRRDPNRNMAGGSLQHKTGERKRERGGQREDRGERN